MKWLWVVFYSIISIVGTVGNTLVILAYRNPRMRSVTNLFIANLGVADLMVTLINVPVTVTFSTLGYWPFGLVLCKSIPYLLGVTIFSSVGTLMAIAADRYRAIVHPLLPRIRTRHAISIIAAIWIVAFIYPIPQIIYQKLHPIDGSCYEDWPSPKNAEIYTVILFVALYLIPLIVISVLYFLICHNLNTTESTAQAGKCLLKFLRYFFIINASAILFVNGKPTEGRIKRKRKIYNHTTQQIVCFYERKKPTYCGLFRNNLLTEDVDSAYAKSETRKFCSIYITVLSSLKLSRRVDH